MQTSESLYSDTVFGVDENNNVHQLKVLKPGEMAGWSDFVPFYDMVVEAAPPDSIIVEVGVFCGKSLIYLAQAAKRANKGLRIYGVDTFKGSPEFEGRVWFDNKPVSQCHPATIIAECVANLQAHGVRDEVTLIMSDSVKAAELFKPQEVFAVMIDAGHDYASVCNDIVAWGNKVVRGGYLAGDDWYGFPGVQQAVKECFDEKDYTVPGCWWQVHMK